LLRLLVMVMAMQVLLLLLLPIVLRLRAPSVFKSSGSARILRSDQHVTLRAGLGAGAAEGQDVDGVLLLLLVKRAALGARTVKKGREGEGVSMGWNSNGRIEQLVVLLLLLLVLLHHDLEHVHGILRGKLVAACSTSNCDGIPCGAPQSLVAKPHALASNVPDSRAAESIRSPLTKMPLRQGCGMIKHRCE
jgi:hypothetical protein